MKTLDKLAEIILGQNRTVNLGQNLTVHVAKIGPERNLYMYMYIYMYMYMCVQDFAFWQDFVSFPDFRPYQGPTYFWLLWLPALKLWTFHTGEKTSICGNHGHAGKQTLVCVCAYMYYIVIFLASCKCKWAHFSRRAVQSRETHESATPRGLATQLISPLRRLKDSYYLPLASLRVAMQAGFVLCFAGNPESEDFCRFEARVSETGDSTGRVVRGKTLDKPDIWNPWWRGRQESEIGHKIAKDEQQKPTFCLFWGCFISAFNIWRLSNVCQLRRRGWNNSTGMWYQSSETAGGLASWSRNAR